METVTKNLKIQGLVQGVGFRYSMRSHAMEVGVTGWVRNRRDGSVEALVQGTATQVEEMVAWAKKGPTGARVENVDVSDSSGNFNDFAIDHSL